MRKIICRLIDSCTHQPAIIEIPIITYVFTNRLAYYIAYIRTSALKENLNIINDPYFSRMADQEQKGLDFLAQAEKKMKNSGGFFGSFFGSVITVLLIIKGRGKLTLLA